MCSTYMVTSASHLYTDWLYRAIPLCWQNHLKPVQAYIKLSTMILEQILYIVFLHSVSVRRIQNYKVYHCDNRSFLF